MTQKEMKKKEKAVPDALNTGTKHEKYKKRQQIMME
jgi:hypothetical protein